MVEAHTPFVYARACAFGGYHQAETIFFKALSDKLNEVIVLRAVDTYAPQFAYDPAVPRFGVSIFDNEFDRFFELPISQNSENEFPVGSMRSYYQHTAIKVFFIAL